MEARTLHSWDVGAQEALAIQERLRVQVCIAPLRAAPHLVAGTDVAYSVTTRRLYAAVVVVALPDLSVVDRAEATGEASFPYVPGLFAFRELPPLLDALGAMRREPDAILFDGHGIAHPRGFGLASHAGVLLDRPTVGCAKSRLVGEHGEVGRERGAYADVRWHGQVVGAALRTQHDIEPVYVSPGHLMDVASAIRLVLATTRRCRLPEPIRLAHQATTATRRRNEGPRG